jgi:CheY-like chemotaxis protein
MPGGKRTSSHRRILIVEDNSRVAAAIYEWFTMFGNTVTVATRGLEALNHVAQVNFDAIICDLMMPEMSGEMFYIATGKLKPRLSERFVFITGHRDQPDIARFLSQYSGPVLEKPFPMFALAAAVDQVASLNRKPEATA